MQKTVISEWKNNIIIGHKLELATTYHIGFVVKVL